MTYTLIEVDALGVTNGICPVCREVWATDPLCRCACTAEQPNDAEQARKALERSRTARESAQRQHVEQAQRRMARLARRGAA